MTMDPADKYRPFAPVGLPDRRWPGRTLERAPRWCSVDLRDGNQALVEPMGPERKRRLFETLLRIGFREIEVGYPSASQTEFDTVRELIEEDRVPEDVTIQVLTPARLELIDRTIESIRGARRVIVHLYNSTSTLQRRVVFGQDRAGIAEIAVRGAARIRELASRLGDTEVILEYSPESFTGTELDFAVEICDAVMREWGASPAAPVILNLPATVEMATPNVYADQIEWFARHVADRASAVLSIHPHNDRGTAVAAAELALLAGAERVEGTLFGNGERSGNVDLVTLALNLYTQGVPPRLDVRDLAEIVAVAEHCTGLPVHPRHPYAGELVFTAFSGTHQDAIKKGLAARAASGSALWEVPYLPIDPADVGRAYEPVVRINSQSGKGGVAFVLEHDFGFLLPKRLQVEFAPVVQEIAERTGTEVSAKSVWDAFEVEYLAPLGPLSIRDETVVEEAGGAAWTLSATLDDGRGEHRIEGRGNGPIDALVTALCRGGRLDLRVVDYREHALGEGADAAAVAYVEVMFADGATRFGVGVHRSIVSASLAAVVSAVNRAFRREGVRPA